jgi:ribosomal protein S27AE
MGGSLPDPGELPLPEDVIRRRRREYWRVDPRKRLFIDLETSPNLATVWRPGPKVNIGFENIVKERAVICAAWKWQGLREVHSLTWDKRQCDKPMLKRVADVVHTADEVVAHNGDRFDVPWIRTRCLKHGIPFSPEIASVDTLKWARSKFYFNSNRLDYISQFLGLGRKNKTGFELWKRVVLDGDGPALERMVRYCKQDVRLLERVHKKLNAYVVAKTSVARDIRNCPECGSEEVTLLKHTTTPAGTPRTRCRCQKCGAAMDLRHGR